jgi:hypothetical protein
MTEGLNLALLLTLQKGEVPNKFVGAGRLRISVME